MSSRMIKMYLIIACCAKNKQLVAKLIRTGWEITDDDRKVLADFIEGKPINFHGFKSKGKGRPPTSNIPYAVNVARHIIRPEVKKDPRLKEKKREMRKQGLRFSFEDEVIKETVRYMEWLGKPVDPEKLRVAYHKSSRPRSK
jgi:hypothetical protein